MKDQYDNIEMTAYVRYALRVQSFLECLLLGPCMVKNIELIVGLIAKLRQLALCYSLHSVKLTKILQK